jgi:predicted CXXCH cytochrome family protein
MALTLRLTQDPSCRNLAGRAPSSFGGHLVLHKNVSEGHRGNRRSLLLFVVGLILLAMPGTASAYVKHEDLNLSSGTREIRGTTTYACEDCHVTFELGNDEFNTAIAGAGPHGYYRSNTNKCRMCHTVHKAPASSILLLPAATIEAACFTCHDATGAEGVYSGIVHRGALVSASHSIDATTHVPGGNDNLSTELTCTSCHAVHRATAVVAFRTDRHLPLVGGSKRSNALLRDNVGGTPVGTYTKYGSDWCAACHDRRHSDSGIMNHPVETSSTGSFNYGRVATVLSATSSQTVIRDDNPLTPGMGLGWTNFGYVMPLPRTAQQTGHDPICQQCHEDPRNVGSVGAVIDFPTAQPRTGQLDFAFPHQSTSANMLIEEHDDLCMNCHPAAKLP